MKEKICGVYMIQSISKPERVYVGSSTDIYKRWRFHLWCLIKQKHASSKLQHHYNKYGKDDLVFSIIEQFIYTDRKFLFEREQIYLDLFDPYFCVFKSAALTRINTHISEEHKEKISKANKNRKDTLEIIEQKRKRQTGVHPSIETRQKISTALKGKPKSEGMKEKLRNRVFTEETRKKMSDGQRGRKCPWVSERNKGNNYGHKNKGIRRGAQSQESKEKRSKKMMGRPYATKGNKRPPPVTK